MVRCFLFYMVISSVLSPSWKIKKKCNYRTIINIRQDHMNDYFNAEFALLWFPICRITTSFTTHAVLSVMRVKPTVAVSIY